VVDKPQPTRTQRVYGAPYRMNKRATRTDDATLEVTVRGLTPADVEACAARECCKHFGETGWSFGACEVKPCMKSLGGRVRLYEGRFVASASPSGPDAA